ncbi:D-alanyl-D-alanine carboxypeptidase precursor [Streptomyces sp. YIM 130001]|uniref:serine hydrolase domain-containing protein n=1 Tax=Streptomyces sp. YIM 130001 TaxID=2259644 RepID=UPI000E65A964|nr:serine hydrolase domain-containing protein [Streptomyces sp. YIM 130001]RII09323.1 D-alanyl-D-alanine carboxypeptidase precursor [Streptomyces sp. YIM 130001]
MQILTFRAVLRRRFAVLGAVFAVVAAAAAPTAVADDAAPNAAVLDAASIDRFVRDYVEQTRLPGAVVAVTEGDRVVHTAGYGHTASGRTMTERTRVPVASLSKAMTALAVMQLVEAGKVRLDRPVRQYLPEFTMADKRAERITVRQLLTQTSGMADSSYPDLARSQPHSLREAVAAMREAPLAADPGSRHRYHNPNYFVAARLVEVVSGQPFASYLDGRLFAPLGMERTASVDTSAEMPDRARGFVRAYGTTVSVSHPRWFTAGGHGVVTTADDFAQWLIAQNNGGVSADGHRIATQATVRATHTPPRIPDDSEYAMGWGEYRADGGPRQIQHTGQLLTHNSMATLLPESKVGIAVVTNTGMIAGDDAPQIVQGLVELAGGHRPEVAAPFSMTADWVLAALTVLAVALGVRGVLRAPRWARRAARRPWWRAALRLLPQVLPVLLLAQLASVVGLLMNRSGTLGQATYAWPALVVCVAAGALASTAVIAARIAAILRRARAGSLPGGGSTAS